MCAVCVVCGLQPSLVFVCVVVSQPASPTGSRLLPFGALFRSSSLARILPCEAHLAGYEITTTLLRRCLRLPRRCREY